MHHATEARRAGSHRVGGTRETTDEVAYVGELTPLGRAVFVREGGFGRPLRLAASARARGYAWGRPGASAKEVARAILIDATGNEMLAERLCRPFTWEVLSGLAPAGFRLGRNEVLAWVSGTVEQADRRPAGK